MKKLLKKLTAGTRPLFTPIGLKAMPLKAKTTTTYRIKLALNSTKLTKIAIFTKKDQNSNKG